MTMEKPPDKSVSIIIVNWNSREMLKDCLNSLYKTLTDITFEIIVVDNDSADQSIEMVEAEFPEVIVINSGGNLGYARANNMGIGRAKYDNLLILNPDTIVKRGTIKSMLEHLQSDQETGLVGCRAVDLNGNVQELGLQWFPSPSKELLKLLFISENSIQKFKKYLPYQNPDISNYVSAMFGMCLMIRKEVIEQVGSFDERFFMYAEDFDLCYRLRQKGWKLYYMSNVEIIHVGGGTSQNSFSAFPTLMMRESISQLMEKYYGKSGVLRYKLALLLGSLVRLTLLYLMKIKDQLGSCSKKDQINQSINKYFTMFKWSVNLERPIIKN